MRPSTMWGFAVGLMVGSLSIAVVATIGLSQAGTIPACEAPASISFATNHEGS